MHYRLAWCPRCNTRVRSVRPETVRIPDDTPVGYTDNAEECSPSDAATYNTEDWHRYEPCGCVVPPEERKTAITEERAQWYP